MVKLFEHISGWYGVKPDFASAVVNKFLPDYDSGIDNLHDFYNKYPEKRVQLEYAFSTNIRGKALRQFLIERGFLNANGLNKRYLDIGCAYGGFLNAFAEIGYSVDGIEYDSELASLCTYHMQISDVPCKIVHSDFLGDHVGHEPIYDLITCNDVIEHVSDPEKCLKKIYAMLKPGGFAYVETVNKMSLKNNTSDIHFQLFGLNLVDNCRAAQMYKQLTGSPFYGVSEFYPLEWYANVVKRLHGAQLTLINSDQDFDYRMDLVAAFEKFAGWEESDGKVIDKFLLDSVKIEFFRYMNFYFSKLEKYQSLNDMDAFHNIFSDPVVRFVMYKSL